MPLPFPAEVTSFFSNQADDVTQTTLAVSQSIFEARTTNLNVVKDKLGKVLQNSETTKPDSNYRRLTRFFALEDQEKESITKALLCATFYILGLKAKKPKYLTLDGTSWELGKDKKIHILTLAVVIQGVAIPICWEDLDKKGTSNLAEREALFKKAFEWYDLKGMTLLADREYIGEEWFKYPINNGLDFVIRLKKNVYKTQIDACCQSKSKEFPQQALRYIGLERKACSPMQASCGVSKRVVILGQEYTFVVFKNPKKDADEPLLYFISTLRNKKQIVNEYPIRWAIECCFKHLKSNGFNLEELNLKAKEKIKLMMAILTFLYAMCIHEGLLAYQQVKKSDWKKYADGKISLTVSIFRKGLAIVEGKFYNIQTFVEFLVTLFHRKIMPTWVHVQ